jgi:hypothetical protein
VLADLETKGSHLKDPVDDIWAGKRDVAALVQSLNEQDTALVKRLLEIINRK